METSHGPLDGCSQIAEVDRLAAAAKLVIFLVHVIQGLHDFFKHIVHSVHNGRCVDVERGEGPSSAFSEQKTETEGWDHEGSKSKEEN